MDQRFGGVAVIRNHGRQRFERLRLKAFVGSLAGFTVLTAIGNFFEPLAGLRVYIGQAGERSQGPEVLPHIADRALHFPFLPGRANVAGAGHEVVFAGKAEEARIETDQVAIVLGDGRGEIVVPDLAAGSRQELKGVNVAAGEGLEALTVRELQKHFAAVAFDQAERIKLAGSALVDERAEVPPVNVAAFSGRWFHTDKRPARHRSFSNGAQVILNNGYAAVVAQWPQPLRDDGRIGGRVLLEQFGYGGFEGIEFTCAVATSGFLRGRLQILRQGAASNPQMVRDPAQRPLLHPMKPMNLADLVRGEHRRPLYRADRDLKPERCSFQDAAVGAAVGSDG